MSVMQRSYCVSDSNSYENVDIKWLDVRGLL